MKEDIFADEWRECLRAHYMHVIRTRDKVTQPSLTVVMHQAGFDDSELAELRVRATMHMDDVGEDFVPDMDVRENDAPIIAVGAPEPFEQVALRDELSGNALIEEVEEAAAEAELLSKEPIPDLPDDESDAPQQLTLF